MTPKRRARRPASRARVADDGRPVEPAGRAASERAGSAVPAISVDPAATRQLIEGFGASITDSSAHVIASSPHRDAIMRSLFDPRHGLGLSYLRQPMGASDFVAGRHYTYDDVPAGRPTSDCAASPALTTAPRSCRSFARRARSIRT
jgi:glucosylceramidase